MSKLKCISGCQNGVDQAALAAAREVGLETGGWIADGCMTLDGCRSDLKELYGLVECDEPGYPARTFRNVRDSDATIRIAKNFNSPGERCTLKAIKRYNKPYLNISIDDPLSVGVVVDWLIRHQIVILNVAGNSEQTVNGIYNIAYNYLLKVFQLWRNKCSGID